MNFGQKWFGEVKWCISTFRYLVLVDSTLVGIFQSSKGPKDPLSPYNS